MTIFFLFSACFSASQALSEKGYKSKKNFFSQMELHVKKGEKSRVDSLKTTPGKHYSAGKKLELEMATTVYLFLTIKVLF